MTIAIYAGTFDPISNGHVDIILRSRKLCSAKDDRLYVAVGLNPNKKTLFSEEERVNMIREVPAIKYCDNNWIQVSSFQGLLIDYAKQIGAKILVRGIRSVSDFEYEINLANINKVLAPEIETVFLPTSPQLAVVSSSMIKEIAKHGGNISDFASPYTVEKVNEKFGFIKTGA